MTDSDSRAGRGGEAGRMPVEVAFALPESQVVIELLVPGGTTVLQAFEMSEIDSYFPDLDLTCLPRGVFGEVVPDATVLAPHDRVEIYRPLTRDPKRARRERVAAATRPPGESGKGR